MKYVEAIYMTLLTLALLSVGVWFFYAVLLTGRDYYP